MEPLKLLLVSFREEWLAPLNQSLHSLGYTFEIHHAYTKKQALFACYQSKYDILITNHQLPDGASHDLVRALGSTVACLVVSEGCPLLPFSAQPEPSHTAKSYPYQIHTTSWIATLKQVLAQWEKSVAEQIARRYQARRSLFAKVTARCAEELHHTTENRVENALKVILDIMEISRIYVREVPVSQRAVSRVVHELSVPGQAYLSGPFSSVFEVPIQKTSEGMIFLGVEDTLNQREWDSTETDFLKTVASLLRKKPEEIQHSIAMYRELGMSA
jgi:hypothetical protein